jgi:hypothetical protein
MAMGQSLAASTSLAAATKPADQIKVLKVPMSNAQRLMAMLHRKQPEHKQPEQEQHPPKNLQTVPPMVGEGNRNNSGGAPAGRNLPSGGNSNRSSGCTR